MSCAKGSVCLFNEMDGGGNGTHKQLLRHSVCLRWKQIKGSFHSSLVSNGGRAEAVLTPLCLPAPCRGPTRGGGHHLGPGHAHPGDFPMGHHHQHHCGRTGMSSPFWSCGPPPFLRRKGFMTDNIIRAFKKIMIRPANKLIFSKYNDKHESPVFATSLAPS